MTRKTVDNRKIVASAQEKFGEHSEQVRNAVSSGQVAVALRALAHSCANTSPKLADEALNFLSHYRLAGEYEEAS